MIVKNLWRRKTRTLLTILGIAVGVAAVVALSAFGEGFATGFESIFSSSDADLIVGQKDAIMLLMSSVDASIQNELRSIPGVEQVAGTVIGVVQMPEAPYFIVMGEDPRSFTIAHYRIIEGGPITTRRQILIGKSTAVNFKKKPGDAFRINEGIYRVAGIYETGVAMEDGGAVMRLDDAQNAFNQRNKVNYFSIKLKDKSRIDDVKAYIESRWEKLAATRSGESTTQSESINMYRSFGWFIGIFAVLIGGLGMMNTSLMSVFERTREIGVLRAVGWGKLRVMSLILGETLWTALLGGVVGILLGVGLTELAKLSPAVSSMLSGVFTPNMFFQAMATAILLGLAGGAYPAWRASRLDPVEAMRYESGAAGAHRIQMTWLSRLFSSNSLRNLWRRPLRTIITVTGIGIGVGFIVAMMAITAGFIVAFNQIAGSGQVDLLAEEANVSDLSLSEIDDRTAARIQNLPEVASISRIILGFSSAPGVPYFFIFGLDLNEDYINRYKVREGRMLARPREMIVGRFAANGLKKGVGDTLRIAGSSYVIVGIYENGSVYEDAGATISLKDAQDLFNKPKKFSLLGIKLQDQYRDQADLVVSRIEDEFPEIKVAKSTEFIEGLQDMKSTYAILNALIVITMIVGGVVMMNAMLMSVFERTQEIGVLRALGWRRSQVIWMILGESLALSLISSILGAGIGIGLNRLLLLEPTFGVWMTASYTPQMFYQVIILALVLGGAGGLYPAWRAANLRPIEALRYE